MDIRLITPEDNVEGEQLLLARMLSAGVEAFHLRKPSFTEKEVLAWLAHWPIRLRPYLVLHSCPHLVDHFQLGGFHLTKRLPKETQEHLIKEKPFPLSCSVHSVDELHHINPSIGTVFISPVFDSISKADYPAAIDLQSLKETLQQLPDRHFQLYALGGISEKTIHLINGIGFDGVAVLGRIWQPFQSEGEGSSFRSFQTIQHAITKRSTIAHY